VYDLVLITQIWSLLRKFGPYYANFVLITQIWSLLRKFLLGLMLFILY